MFDFNLNPRAPSFKPMASNSESREHTKMANRSLDPRTPSFEPMANKSKSREQTTMVNRNLNPRVSSVKPMASNNETQANRAAITALNARSSPLLRLPGELRNEIYTYVLDIGGYIFPYEDRLTLASEASGERKNRHALIGVCRQIHEETALLPFSLNGFYFACYNGFLDFCLATGPTKRRAIRQLCLDGGIFGSTKFVHSMQSRHSFSSLSQFLPNIQRVHVVTKTFSNQDHRCWPNMKARCEQMLEDWLGNGLRMTWI